MKTLIKIKVAIVHILATFNNTIVTVTDNAGKCLLWSSSGSSGFKGSRKSTPYAAQTASSEILKKIKSLGIKIISIYIQGPGNGRESAIKALISNKISIVCIKDVTSIPHNGCRKRKKRRV